MITAPKSIRETYERLKRSAKMSKSKTEDIYRKTQRQIQREYNDALDSMLKKSLKYLKTVQNVQNGKLKPPSSFKSEAQIEAWRRGYLRRYVNKTRVIEEMTEEMRNAGVKCRKSIITAMNKIYGSESSSVIHSLNLEKIIPAKKTNEISILLDNNLSTFDKGALEKLSNAAVARQRLRREFAVGIMQGDNDEKMRKRIMNVTGMEERHAQVVLRTEKTRVSGMAQQITAQECYKKTKRKPFKRWICMFHNSRESHMDNHDEVVAFDERFSNGLLYPGDESAPANETVNCQCEMVVFYAD